MASTTGQQGRGGKFTSWLSKVFELNPAGFAWPRAVMVLDVTLVPLVVFWAIGHEEYHLSALFGLLFSVLADPGGGYSHRAGHIAGFGLIGAGPDRAGVRHQRQRLGLAGACGLRGHADHVRADPRHRHCRYYRARAD